MINRMFAEILLHRIDRRPCFCCRRQLVHIPTVQRHRRWRGGQQHLRQRPWGGYWQRLSLRQGIHLFHRRLHARGDEGPHGRSRVRDEAAGTVGPNLSVLAKLADWSLHLYNSWCSWPTGDNYNFTINRIYTHFSNNFNFWSYFRFQFLTELYIFYRSRSSTRKYVIFCSGLARSHCVLGGGGLSEVDSHRGFQFVLSFAVCCQ